MVSGESEPARTMRNLHRGSQVHPSLVALVDPSAPVWTASIYPMNYQTHYARLIDRARYRVLIGYFERHHVVPRCMGGGNASANIVRLTAEEHYVAHQLLIKIHPANYQLAHAAVWMAKRASGNKAYGWIRRRHAEAVSKRQVGTIKTPDQCRKISESKKGKPHPRTPEWTAKIAASNRGRKHSAETIAKITNHNIGNTYNLGRKFTAEHRAKIGISHIGNTNRLGAQNSKEHRQKISAALRGHVLTDETRAKIGDAQRAAWERRRIT